MFISQKRFNQLQDALNEKEDALTDERNLRIDAETKVNDLTREMRTVDNVRTQHIEELRASLEAQKAATQNQYESAEAMFDQGLGNYAKAGQAVKRTVERLYLIEQLLPKREDQEAEGHGNIIVDTIRRTIEDARKDLNFVLEASAEAEDLLAEKAEMVAAKELFTSMFGDVEPNRLSATLSGILDDNGRDLAAQKG